MNAQTASALISQNSEQVARGHQQLQAVLDRSATDKAFRQALIADPHKTLSEFTGETVPSEYNIAFIENVADVTVVLPNAIDEASELSEAELQAVAGGSEPVAIGLAIFAASMMLGITIARQ